MSALATPESATTGCRGEPGSGEQRVFEVLAGQTRFRPRAFVATLWAGTFA